MTRSCHTLFVLALLVVVGSACNSGSVTDPQIEADANLERLMAEVVAETDALVGDVLDTETNSSTGGSRAVLTTDVSFSRTRPCPLGGDISVVGDMHRTLDTDLVTMEASLSGEKTWTGCAIMKDEFVVTVDGSATWDAFRRRVDGLPDGLQTTSYAGSMHAVRDDGEERSCDFSIDTVRDPETHTRSVTALICGREFTITQTWEPTQGG